MPHDSLDRTMWPLGQALSHICNIKRLHHERAKGQKLRLTDFDVRQVLLPDENKSKSVWLQINRNAQLQLRQALLLGDLQAHGRLSRFRNPHFPELDGQEWIFHSAQTVRIQPDDWVNGYLHLPEHNRAERLELEDGEYIDIQIPRFMVEAIWTMPPAKPVEPTEYTTPYLELIKLAISENRITDMDQSKKEALVDWFMDQHIEGEPLSANLAKAMATIIRMPSSQRGGSKRSW